MVLAVFVVTAIGMGGSVIAFLTADDPLAVVAFVEGVEVTAALIGVMLLSYGLIYAFMTHRVFRRLRGDELREVARRSAARTSGRRLVLLLMTGGEISFPVTTVLLSLVGVVWLVLVPDFTSNATLIVGALAGLVGGWLMMVTSFTVSYLREWAVRDSVRFPDPAIAEDAAEVAGVGAAPGGGTGAAQLRVTERRFSDFTYVGVQFATAFSPADFQLVAPRVRTIATMNSILAFLYSTVIVGMFLSFAVSSAFAA